MSKVIAAGMRVLLIDADPQGNATAAVGYDEPDMLSDTLASVMLKAIKDEEIEPGYAILHNAGGFDVLPGNIELSELEAILVNVMDRERVLKQFITMVRPMYEYIIIDCAPSLGTITTNAFVVSVALVRMVNSWLKDRTLDRIGPKLVLAIIYVA